MTAGRICADMAQAVKIAISRGAGATLGAVAARKLEDAEAFANDLGCAKAYGGDSAYDDICAVPPPLPPPPPVTIPSHPEACTAT